MAASGHGDSEETHGSATLIHEEQVGHYGGAERKSTRKYAIERSCDEKMPVCMSVSAAEYGDESYQSGSEEDRPTSVLVGYRYPYPGCDSVEGDTDSPGVKSATTSHGERRQRLTFDRKP